MLCTNLTVLGDLKFKFSSLQEKFAKDKARLQQRRNSQSGDEDERSPRKHSLPNISGGLVEKSSRKGIAVILFAYTFSENIFHIETTLKCLSIGTPKTINFPFVPNGKLMVFRCPNI